LLVRRLGAVASKVTAVITDEGQIGDETLNLARSDWAGKYPALYDLIAATLKGDDAEAGFEVHYQPIVRLEDNAIVALEALARWSHPLVGNISPRLFVGVAEALGLMGVIDDFVLDRACADADALAQQYGGPVDVHVNVSAPRLGQRELELSIARALARRHLAPGKLVVEITETARITNLGRAAAATRRIRARGVRIALDDFGAGFSSLGRLRNLSVDIVKLDRSATRVEADSEHSVALCRTLRLLRKHVNIPIVAEGVETDWQPQVLARLGCHLGQGYLYGPAKPLSRPSAPHIQSATLRASIAV
jgi:EAL domain-containing protein (putative c-di-GMP-specific phosphodiesterase class I)